jgi:hypothetical protein
MVAAAKASTSSVSAQVQSSIDKASEYFKNVKEEVINFTRAYRPQFLSNASLEKNRESIFIKDSSGNRLMYHDKVLDFGSAETLIASAGGVYAAFLIANEVAYWCNKDFDTVYLRFIGLMHGVLEAGKLVPVNKEVRKQALCDYGDFFIYEGEYRPYLFIGRECTFFKYISSRGMYTHCPSDNTKVFFKLNKKFWESANYTSVGVYGPLLRRESISDALKACIKPLRLDLIDNLKKELEHPRRKACTKPLHPVRYKELEYLRRFEFNKKISLDINDFSHIATTIANLYKFGDFVEVCPMLDGMLSFGLLDILLRVDTSKEDCTYWLLMRIHELKEKMCNLPVNYNKVKKKWNKYIKPHIPKNPTTLQYLNLLAIRDIQMLALGLSRENCCLERHTGAPKDCGPENE